jgi:hypothetical protein
MDRRKNFNVEGSSCDFTGALLESFTVIAGLFGDENIEVCW